MQNARRHNANFGISVAEPDSGSAIPGPLLDDQANAHLRRLLNFKQLRAMGLSWSREHVWRLEAANKFPRRIYLSAQKVAWFEDEVLEWLEQRVADRRDRVYRHHD